MFNGLFSPPWWGYVLVTLAMAHVTIAAVTLYLHRHQAHHAVDLHPLVAHFFRFWLWLTTGQDTRAWVAIHRKHHACCETADDPHSPQVRGIRKVLWQGAELYRAEAANAETLRRYGSGTPDDWLERHLYSRHSVWGVSLMMIIDLILFGPIGLTVWAVQMLWIPFFAAGVINGIGHFWGYRHFSCNDASRNIVPWGILIGGEELHNNHHGYSYSAKFSNRWYEFDIGWLYIRLLQMLGAAQVRKRAPRLRWGTVKALCDAELLQAIITHRYDLLGRYVRLMKRCARLELRELRRKLPDLAAGLSTGQLRRWISQDPTILPVAEQTRLQQVLAGSPQLATLYGMRQELTDLWARSTASRDQLVGQLQDWCARAEHSGIATLARFSQQLRRCRSYG